MHDENSYNSFVKQLMIQHDKMLVIKKQHLMIHCKMILFQVTWYGDKQQLTDFTLINLCQILQFLFLKLFVALLSPTLLS